jgi:hypothetical protein
MSCMGFNARLDTSHHGPTHPFKDGGVVADSLTRIHNAMKLGTQGLSGAPTGKNTEDSNVASVNAMHSVLLHLFISYDRFF